MVIRWRLVDLAIVTSSQFPKGTSAPRTRAGRTRVAESSTALRTASAFRSSKGSRPGGRARCRPRRATPALAAPTPSAPCCPTASPSALVFPATWRAPTPSGAVSRSATRATPTLAERALSAMPIGGRRASVLNPQSETPSNRAQVRKCSLKK